jgi:GNAT superfamily N-acetyltransferase
MMEASIIRAASLDDVDAIRRLIDASVRLLSVGYYSNAEIESGLRFVFGPDTQLIADGTYFVMDASDGLAAAGGWSRRRTLYGGDQFKEERDPLLDPTTESAKIRAFFVHPAYARRGLATRLYAECERAARREGFRSFELGATLPGVPLYRALGFVEGERVDAVLPNGTTLPVVRMVRSIAEEHGFSRIPGARE